MALDAVGFVSGALGIVQFIMDNGGSEPPDIDTSTVTIAIGLDGTPDPNNPDRTLDGAGGDAPVLYAWDESLEDIGWGAFIENPDDGQTISGLIYPLDNGKQAPYLVVGNGGSDAICIAYVTITWPDDSKYAWLGDWGQACDATWYWSNIFVNNDNYAPKCTWIDEDDYNTAKGFSIHFPSFVDHNRPHADAAEYCANHDTFEVRWDDNFDTISDGGNPIITRDAPPSAPKPPASSAKHQGRLVISKDTKNHPTEELCGHHRSAGPDFLNLAEGKFCCMQTKTLWPVCREEVQSDCFDVDSKQLVRTGVKGLQTRSEPYWRVDDWTPKQG